MALKLRVINMSHTVNIEPVLETQLRREAAKHGLDLHDYVMNALRERLLRDQKHTILHLSERESQLLQHINMGLPEAFWRRYRELIEKRRDESLMTDEQHELIQMSDQLEDLNANRMENLVELAQMRNVPLKDLMKQLGIAPTHV